MSINYGKFHFQSTKVVYFNFKNSLVKKKTNKTQGVTLSQQLMLKLTKFQNLSFWLRNKCLFSCKSKIVDIILSNLSSTTNYKLKLNQEISLSSISFMTFKSNHFPLAFKNMGDSSLEMKWELERLFSQLQWSVHIGINGLS